MATTEADGVPCVDVSDAKTGASFRFYDFEYQLALQLNGQPLAQVIAWATQTYGVDLKDEGIAEFSGRLSELGFLETGATATEPAPEADSAADEWMSPQGTKTAQFFPDPAMLAGAPGPSLDRTPVATLDMLPDMRDDAEAAPHVAPAPVTTPTPAVPPVVATTTAAAKSAAAPAPAAPTAPANASESAKSRWAVDLDGALQAPDSPAAVMAPAMPAIQPEVSLPPRPVAVPAPAGIAERRQPPAPDSVVMSGFSEEAKRGGARKSSGPPIWLLVVILMLGIGAALAGFFYFNRQPVKAPQALRVRVMSPTPSAVYRWFSGRGAVTDYETGAVSFTGPGRLVELLPTGTELEVGDIIGKLQGATAIETLLAHDRSRVGFYRQLRDSMRAAGNQAELHLAELRLAEKEHLVAESRANLARFTVAATEPGEVVETLAKIGTPVLPGAPVARVKGKLLHGAFELDADDQVSLARLDFCRVEVIGLGPRAENTPPPGTPAARALTDSGPAAAQNGPHFVDCQSPTPVSPGRNRVEVALPGDLGLVSGQPLRLARRRYDAVFPVPAAALVGAGADQKSIWIAGRDGRAEARAVSVADLGDEVLVSGGLQVGDRVIVDPPAGLKSGAPIVAAP